MPDKQFLRTAYKPIVEPGDGTPTDSKFSGTPWLAEHEKWPTCPNCDNSMQLFVQLNLATLPEEHREKHGTGLLQMFYCTNEDPMCECDCEAYAPFSKSVVTRIVQPNGAGAAVPPDGRPEAPFPAKRIVGWNPMEDYPNGEELDAIGGRLSDEEESDYEWPKQEDKLGGWPSWVQNMEYPSCRKCGKQMELVFQIDSEDNLPYMFGDVGCGHITQCPVHPDELAFGWACC